MKPITVQTTMLFDDPNGNEIEVSISGTYHKPSKGRFVKGEGQIEPDEDACIDDVQAEHEGKAVELTERQMEQAIEKLMEVASES